MVRTQLLIICLAAFILTAAGTGGASAQASPETPEEFITGLNELRGSEALSQYPEFDLARGQAIVEVQTENNFTQQDRKQMTSLLNALIAFERAYATAEEDPVESLDHADEAYASLEELDQAGGERYAALGSVALERFYAVQGERVYEAAQEADSTPKELELLSAAVHAYERSGDTERYSEIQVERDQLRSQYGSDMQRHDELIGTAETFAADCQVTCEGVTAAVTHPLRSITEYTLALRSYEAAVEAEAIAEEHGVTGTDNRAAELRETAGNALVTAGITSVITVFAYAISMIVLAGLIVQRLTIWAGDAQAAARDQILTPLEVDDA